MSADPASLARRNRWMLVAVVALCVAPLAAAWLLTALLPDWRPFGTAHHGRLVDPPRTITVAGLSSPGEGGIAADYFYGKWTLLLAPASPCDEDCRQLLYRTRQARRALGRDMGRVQRLWVTPPDMAPAEPGELLAPHPELRLARAGASWFQSLPERAAATRAPGAVYVVDPRARVMMVYGKDASAEDMLDDLRRLLRASGIG